MIRLRPSWTWETWLQLIFISANVCFFLLTDKQSVSAFGYHKPLCYEYGLCCGNVHISFAPIWFVVFFVQQCWENGILDDSSPFIVRDILVDLFTVWPIFAQQFGFTMWCIYIYQDLRNSTLRKDQKKYARINAIEKRNITDQQVKIAVCSEKLTELKAIIYDRSASRADLYNAMAERSLLVADMSADNVDWLMRGMSKKDPGYDRILKRVKEHAAIWKERKEQHFAKGKSAASWFAWVEKHICTGPLVLERKN